MIFIYILSPILIILHFSFFVFFLICSLDTIIIKRKTNFYPIEKIEKYENGLFITYYLPELRKIKRVFVNLNNIAISDNNQVKITSGLTLITNENYIINEEFFLTKETYYKVFE